MPPLPMNKRKKRGNSTLVVEERELERRRGDAKKTRVEAEVRRKSASGQGR